MVVIPTSHAAASQRGFTSDRRANEANETRVLPRKQSEVRLSYPRSAAPGLTNLLGSAQGVARSVARVAGTFLPLRNCPVQERDRKGLIQPPNRQLRPPAVKQSIPHDLMIHCPGCGVFAVRVPVRVRSFDHPRDVSVICKLIIMILHRSARSKMLRRTLCTSKVVFN